MSKYNKMETDWISILLVVTLPLSTETVLFLKKSRWRFVEDSFDSFFSWLPPQIQFPKLNSSPIALMNRYVVRNVMICIISCLSSLFDFVCIFLFQLSTRDRVWRSDQWSVKIMQLPKLCNLIISSLAKSFLPYRISFWALIFHSYM